MIHFFKTYSWYISSKLKRFN